VLTIGSLFSGIGGFELGLEWAGLGPTLWQVEIDPKARLVLADHWPDVKRYEDVRTVGAATLERVDLVCGGFPCQDISSAGPRVGLAGARSGLWYEFARVVEEMRPQWVVVENVGGNGSAWVDAVRGDLERRGYATLPVPLEAADLGAPYARARIFIVGRIAGCDDEELREGGGIGWRSTSRIATPDADRAELRIEHRRVGGSHGDAAAFATEVAPDAHRGRQLQPQGREPSLRRRSSDGDRHWAAEPDVARVVSRLPGRVDRERLLGNCVVPQVAEVIGWVIREMANAR
jgi:DNA (cytosine-5)-methyltransferase 1